MDLRKRHWAVLPGLSLVVMKVLSEHLKLGGVVVLSFGLATVACFLRLQRPGWAQRTGRWFAAITGSAAGVFGSLLAYGLFQIGASVGVIAMAVVAAITGFSAFTFVAFAPGSQP